MKNLYNHKLHIKQKEMENMKFSEILERLIELQKTENFCRVKENLTKFDIIARILRKENYLIAMISNSILDLDFKIKIPFKKTEKKINFFSNYFYNNLSECIINFAFLPGDVNINSKFFNLRYLQMKMFIFMIFEIFFIPPVIFFKIIFWIFKNAEGFSKTNRSGNNSLSQKIWSNYIQIIFKNYNELPHHFENRINNSYKPLDNFMNCFRDRMFSILSKFVIIICGSFLFLVFIISSIDDRLLTDLKIFGKKFVWLTFILGAVLSILGGGNNKNNSFEEDYIENVSIKEDLYTNFVNKIINLPFEFRQKQNFSSIFKTVSLNYEIGIYCLLKEILSILFFPFLWIKIIFKAQNIIKFFKAYSKTVEGIGTIYSYSIMDLNTFKFLKEKDLCGITEATFNDRKFINSFIWYFRNFGDEEAGEAVPNDENLEEYEVYESQTMNDPQKEIEFKYTSNNIFDKNNLRTQIKNLEDKLFQVYKKEISYKNYKESKLDLDKMKSNFREFIFFHISQVNNI